jgi:hypothetical protein
MTTKYFFIKYKNATSVFTAGGRLFHSRNAAESSGLGEVKEIKRTGSGVESEIKDSNTESDKKTENQVKK